MRCKVICTAFLCLMLAGFSCKKNEPVPVADFAFIGSNEFQAPCHLIFENKSINSFAFHWEFGDDSISTIKNPEHWFITPGVYKIKLQSYTESGKEWASSTKSVTIR